MKSRIAGLCWSCILFVHGLTGVGHGQGPIVLKSQESRVFDVGFSPDGKRLAVAHEDGSFRIWDLDSKKEIVSRPQAHPRHCRSISWSLDGVSIWTTGDEGAVQCWDATNAKSIGEARKVEKPYRVIVGPKPPRVIVASHDAKIHRLSISGLDASDQTLSGHLAPIRDVAASSDGKFLASCGNDNLMKLWSVESGVCLHTQTGSLGGRLFAVDFTPDGTKVAVAGDGGKIQLIDTKSMKVILDWQAQEREIRSLSFSRDGRFLASAGEDSEVRLWNVGTGKQLTTLSGQKIKSYKVEFSPIDNSIAAGRADGGVEFWPNVALN